MYKDGFGDLIEAHYREAAPMIKDRHQTAPGPECTQRRDLAAIAILLRSGCAKGAAKGSCGETVVQKGVFGESVSSLPP